MDVIQRSRERQVYHTTIYTGTHTFDCMRAKFHYLHNRFIMSSSSPKSSYNEPRSPRPGPVPVSIGVRTRQLLPRDPQAIFNPNLTKHLVLADSQGIHPLIEIVNPPPPLSRKRSEYGLGHEREKGGLKKRRTTTREERLEALTFLENGREWHEDINGIACYQNLIVVSFSF